MILWSDDYATGIQRVDAQHRRLFETFNDLEAALGGEYLATIYASTLRFLNRYTRAHFEYVEGCLIACQCPMARINRRAHEQFETMLENHARRFAAEGYSEALARDLVDTAQEWLRDHLCSADIDLRACLHRAQATAGADVDPPDDHDRWHVGAAESQCMHQPYE